MLAWGFSTTRLFKLQKRAIRLISLSKFNSHTEPLFKGIHTEYFSSSIYIINQKPMIPRTHFHCVTTWVAHSCGCHAFAYFVVSVY